MLPADRIQVMVEDGCVTLTGTVSDAAAKTALGDAAKAAFGAENVLDELTVEGTFLIPFENFASAWSGLTIATCCQS